MKLVSDLKKSKSNSSYFFNSHWNICFRIYIINFFLYGISDYGLLMNIPDPLGVTSHTSKELHFLNAPFHTLCT